MISNTVKFHLPSAIVLGIILTAVFIFSGSVFAQVLPPADTCRIRTAISLDELTSLVGPGTLVTHYTPSVGIPAGTALNFQDDGAGVVCVYSLIKTITNWVFIAVLAISTLMLAFAAFLYVTGGTSTKKAGQARSVIIFAIIGLLVALVARVVPSIARSIIGV